ncbi:MAG: hypothetical protein AAFQ82_04130 [Myxococcota bacterium]
MNVQWTTLILVTLVLSAGCAGARYQVKADGLSYPVSMSGALPDQSGNLFVLHHGLEVLGDIDESWRAWGVLYGETGTDVEVSEAISTRIRELGGDGAAAVTVTTANCGINYWPTLIVLPFFPGCVSVHVEGHVVRVKDPQSPDIVRPSTAVAQERGTP